MRNPITITLGNGITLTQDANGDVTLSGGGLSATSSPGSPSILPAIPTSIIGKILSVVEAALPAISTVLPAAGPIAGLVAIGIQVAENLFGGTKKGTAPAGAQKLQAVSSSVNSYVVAQHSTIPNAPPLPAGSAAAVTQMVQSAVDIYKAAGQL